MDFLYTLRSYLSSILPITLWDLLDIAVLAVIIYKGITIVKETRAGGLLKGIAVLLAAYLVMKYFFHMKAMAYILENVFSIGMLAILILFQPELRRTIEKMGQSKITRIPVLSSIGSEPYDAVTAKWNTAIEAICDACEDLSATTTGALIVIERESKLGEQIDTGTILNAAPSKELFGNIFFKNTPLHDGAVIMRDGIILAAACFLPKPQKEEAINKQLGSRHRAAIGMSENSDALVIAVSEETGVISVAENGSLERGFSRDSLKKYLRSKLIPEKNQPRPKPTKQSKPHHEKKSIFGGSKNPDGLNSGGSDNEKNS
ncbi:MAG: diadenylate cyclase CdaA [Oscillospiraceae bacterium]|nr:diadenylate cyclase CdaA [Oscillospiraceae bacterium]